MRRGLVLAVLAVLAAPLVAEAGRSVAKVRLEGNSRVEAAAIRVHIGQPTGAPLDEDRIDRDIKAIYGMGFFDDVWVSTKPSPQGPVLVYHVKERPYVTGIEFEGIDKVIREDVEAVINVRERNILDPRQAWLGIQQARKLYTSEGYPDASIEYELRPGEDNTAEIVYSIEEGPLVRVADIRLEGVRVFKQRALRKLMTTRSEWMLSWLTGAGLLNEDELATDVERLTAYYYDNGYIHVRVDEPFIERVDDGMVVTIRIEEGPLFKIGEITFAGQLLLPEDRLLAISRLTAGGVFRASELREAIFALTEAYGDLGHAFADVVPGTRVRAEDEEVDIAFEFDGGPVVAVRRIEIRGNTKTRDHVVRRALRLQEGQRFSGSGLTRSKVRIQRSGHFETVELSTKRTGTEDEVDLLVEVKEGRTGSFSAGAGYSSDDEVLFNARIAERNLFGRGQSLVVNTDMGTIRQNFQFSFTEPWFGGRPLSLGFDLFDWQLEFDRFVRGGRGFAVRLSYPLEELGLYRLARLSLRDVRAGIEYRLEESEIDGIRRAAPPSVKAEEGARMTSSVKPVITRNTLDHPFDPTRGSRQILSAEFAGLGGDTDFLKIEASSRWFWPVYATKAGRRLVHSLGVRLGFGLGDSGASGEELPLFKRYFPGGINSVRGYDTRSLGPEEEFREDDGVSYVKEAIGGSQQLIITNELIFPVLADAGLKAVVFVDAGNAFTASGGIDLGDLRYAVGWGIRWLSPMGPLRIEVGYPLDPKDGEDSSIVQFSLGAPF